MPNQLPSEPEVPAVTRGCPGCDAGDHGRERREGGLRHRSTVPAPSVDRPWSGSTRAAPDGCWVETDGICPHGHRSWQRGHGIGLMHAQPTSVVTSLDQIVQQTCSQLCPIFEQMEWVEDEIQQAQRRHSAQSALL